MASCGFIMVSDCSFFLLLVLIVFLLVSSGFLWFPMASNFMFLCSYVVLVVAHIVQCLRFLIAPYAWLCYGFLCLLDVFLSLAYGFL